MSGDLLIMLEEGGIGHWLRFSRWGYAATSTAHVLGISTLFGAVLALDLRLLGLWQSVPLTPLARLLAPVAATGLLLAVATGALLFLSQATQYGGLALFWVKLALIACGAALALWVSLRRPLHALRPAAGRWVGGASLACWLLALVCGRMIAFVGD